MILISKHNYYFQDSKRWFSDSNLQAPLLGQYITEPLVRNMCSKGITCRIVTSCLCADQFRAAFAQTPANPHLGHALWRLRPALVQDTLGKVFSQMQKVCLPDIGQELPEEER